AKEFPSSKLAANVFYGDWDNPQEILKLARTVNIVSLENEFVDANSLKKVEQAGYTVLPSAKTISLVQDKLIQKQTLADAGIAVAAFAGVSSREDIINESKRLGWPLVLKARRNGYDGKGNATLKSEQDIDNAWNKLDGENRELYVEGFCQFTMELAVMVTRSRDGEIATYPVVESVQRDHICHIVRAPAKIDDSLINDATELACKAVESIDGIGTIGVEMFLTKDNHIVLNEMAPRVHNSGHYTIEACECSQFENHVRAILGWPLGSTNMVSPAAVMINLLGEMQGNGYPAGIDDALQVNGAHIHVYGKTTTSIGRKMGHVTALGQSVDDAEHIAQCAAKSIRFGAQK
ncbi:MAG: 5-(carboxyamino)imidazole ribonucleotide synthase, partial [Proteobacteria bacterium]|nr:5-(carboxyamino)imidazole ribonucleotide synthase [Pseudomonadota bacterium]